MTKFEDARPFDEPLPDKTQGEPTLEFVAELEKNDEELSKISPILGLIFGIETRIQRGHAEQALTDTESSVKADIDSL